MLPAIALLILFGALAGGAVYGFFGVYWWELRELMKRDSDG